MPENRAGGTPLIPVLDIGGTHVSAALVDAVAGTLVGPAHRRALDGGAPAADIIAAVVAAAAALALPGAATWGVAMPDPFDYARGIGLFDGVGKFESLRGVDLGAVLGVRLPGWPRGLVFLNDADAFTLGEWAYGAASGHRRCAGFTLGTGVGSGWVVDGRIVASGPGVPADGRARHLRVHGAPLEDTVSTRAIRRAYDAATGTAGADVRTIAARARDGEAAARSVLRAAMAALGGALGPCVLDFAADVVVIGGSMAASWDLFGPWFRDGFGRAADLPPIVAAAHPDHAALLGAARFARDAVG